MVHGYIVREYFRRKQMGDTSQSRYSIVAKLTQEKLAIISAQANLDSEIAKTTEMVESLKEDLKDWEKTVKEDIEKTKRDKLRQIKNFERDANNAKTRKKSKEESYKMKIKTLDEALQHIQRISEYSASGSSPA